MQKATTTERYPLASAYIHLPEKEIIRRCQAGDCEAFNVLISRYENRVINLTVRYLHDYHQAMDAAQEVFVKIYKNIKNFKGNSAFNTWVYAVTTNHCFNILAKKKRALSSPKNISLDEAQENMPVIALDSKSRRPDEEVQTKELNQRVRAAIAELPVDQQQMIILFHYENLSYEEIAEIVEAPISTVASCLFRARQNLRKILARKGGRRK